ncbi:unnamed protein product [Moneuplotes crassus]|uniref:Uncharacterized protein n=1 Tax=Euplotes crassus TaxID=5936 RepID=A0AAD1X1L0_EUPCR|nr:unnamed protein product [Moneuplotes crassus]
MEKLYSVDYEQEGLKKKYKNRFLNIDDPNRRIKMINKEELNNFVETVKKYRERVAKRKELYLNNSCETPVRSVNQIVNLKIKDDESTNLNSESLNVSLPVTSSSKVVHKTPTKVKVKRSKLTKFPKNPKNSKKLKNWKNLKLF